MSLEIVDVRVKSIHPEMFAHWSDAQGCWCTHDHWIYRYDYVSEGLTRVFRLPAKSNSLMDRFKDTVARSLPRRRWRPGPGIQHLVRLANNDILVVYDRIYWYSPGQHAQVAEPLTNEVIPPLATPLRGGMAVHAQSQHVYYGEYVNRHHSDPRGIRVVRVDVASRRIDVCWEFVRSEIKHIHAIHYDRFRNRLWICTGDQDHESAFYYTDDEFSTVNRFAGGDQSWRAIALLFDESGMEWGMDAGKDAPADAVNRIYRFEFATGQRRELAVIGNPAYAACEFTDGTAVMQTTFEPGRQQNTLEEAALWQRGADRVWRKAFSAPYRLQPGEGRGLYGMLLMPGGVQPAGQVLFTPTHCSAGNRRMHSIQMNAVYDN